MKGPMQPVVKSEPYNSLTGQDRVRYSLACGHDVTRDKPRGKKPIRLRCDTCPTVKRARNP